MEEGQEQRGKWRAEAHLVPHWVAWLLLPWVALGGVAWFCKHLPATCQPPTWQSVLGLALRFASGMLVEVTWVKVCNWDFALAGLPSSREHGPGGVYFLKNETCGTVLNITHSLEQAPLRSAEPPQTYARNRCIFACVTEHWGGLWRGVIMTIIDKRHHQVKLRIVMTILRQT